MEDQYIGLTFEELIIILKNEGKSCRCVVNNGQPMICTMDYRLDRLNVILKDSVVIGVRGWG